MHNALKYTHRMIDTLPVLKSAALDLARATSVAIDLEAFCNDDPKHLGQISLLQMCSAQAQPVVYIVDVLSLGREAVVSEMGELLQRESIRKTMFDCRRDVEALSTQMGVKPRGVLDLQLYHTAITWKSKGSNRRSGLGYVLKNMCNLDRQLADSAVSAAMTLGKRAVWDVRPLPDHFLEYAADDVRNMLVLEEKVDIEHKDIEEAVTRLTMQYVEHYAVGKLIEVEADPAANVVLTDWLERYLGPGGKCTYCGQKGHTSDECFRRGTGQVKCTHCGECGHLAKNCFKKHPQRLKCTHCGQTGHIAAKCYAKNPCAHCGGQHPSEKCSVQAMRAQNGDAAEETGSK